MAEGTQLVPLVYRMVMDEHRFDLNRSEKTLLFNRTIVNVESNDGVFRCDIAVYGIINIPMMSSV